MKKFFIMALVAASLTACNDNDADDNDATVTTEDATTTTTTTTAYTPAEGDATYRNGKVMVWKGNDWVAADNDVNMDDNVVVYRNGEVKRDGKVVVLHDGEVVSRTGRFFDNAGNAIDNAWDATKEGVKDAGRAVEKAAQKTGDAIGHDHDTIH